MYYLDSRVENLYRIFDQNARKDYLRLDLNENPGGLPQEFIDDVLKNVTPQFVAQYPETLHFTEVLANHLGTDISHICLTNGSAEGIRYIIQAFTSVNGRIVGVVPSYFMFQVYSEMYGRNFVKVPYKEDLSMDVNDIIREMTDDTQLLILLNPNNPMGNVYSDDEFESIMKVARQKQITVLVDEAYHYFYPKTFIKYALTEDHVFITRTFSKLFSMAGCRLGYVVGWSDGVKMVQKMCTPHNTNAFAMMFAEKVLTTPGMLDSLITNFNGGRKYLVDSLDINGYRHKGEAGNFIFIEPKTDAQTIVDRMKAEKKILIKAYPNVGEFGNCLRVSIGEEKMAKLGLTTRGIYGEGSEALGDLYQVSNQVTLGRTEEEIIEAVTAVVRQLIDMELSLRARCLKEQPMDLRDALLRSYGLLRYALRMDEKEFMLHWSHLRLGAAMGLLPVSLAAADDLLTVAQDAHARRYAQETAPGEEADAARCDIIRKTLETNV